MWCPDPACRAVVPEPLWTITEYGTKPFDRESPELYHWRADCPSCGRSISAWHGIELDVAAIPEPDPAGWCCPLCARPAELKATNRGPLGAYLQCLEGGCEAKATVSRRPLAELLRRAND